MPIRFDVLGAPGRDNALLARIETGQAVHRLLFDCGGGCLDTLTVSEIQAIDHLFFSHFHMDHVAGFDTFFRLNYNRERPVHVWGPPQTIAIMGHRFRGFLWNLHGGQPGEWIAHEIDNGEVRTARFLTAEAFATMHPAESRPHDDPILDEAEFTVSATLLDHGTPSAGYVVQEKTRVNVDTERLAQLGLAPGPWLQRVKSGAAVSETVEIAGVVHDVADLRAKLLVETPGDSLAYLTDFHWNPGDSGAADLIRGCRTLVCESQYRAADHELAAKNRHMTAPLTAGLARAAGVERLILFHLSDRYQDEEWLELLQEARTVFLNSAFPEVWNATFKPSNVAPEP